jgi:hypothetical protein
MVPNVRLTEDVIQSTATLVVTAVAALGGLVTKGMLGFLAGTLTGLVGAVVVSGGVLMFVGWLRAVRRR